MANFAKGEEAWKEFNFEFEVVFGAESTELLHVLKFFETATDEFDTDKVRAHSDPDQADQIDIEKIWSELYEVLAGLTVGEAKMMVRNVSSQDGIFVWHRLYLHHNLRTMFRVLRIRREAMHSRPVESLISSIVEWEDRWDRMAGEHKTTMPAVRRMAALMELCPPDVQDMIYQNVGDVRGDHERLKQRIISWGGE